MPHAYTHSEWCKLRVRRSHKYKQHRPTSHNAAKCTLRNADNGQQKTSPASTTGPRGRGLGLLGVGVQWPFVALTGHRRLHNADNGQRTTNPASTTGPRGWGSGAVALTGYRKQYLQNAQLQLDSRQNARPRTSCAIRGARGRGIGRRSSGGELRGAPLSVNRHGQRTTAQQQLLCLQHPVPRAGTGRRASACDWSPAWARLLPLFASPLWG
jgi:hypothetical protein